MAWQKRPASRSLVAVLAIAIVAGATGCSVTKSAYGCTNANCVIKLSGDGAAVEIDSLDLKVVLAGTDGEKATLQVLREPGKGDETIELARGESARALDTKFTLVRVKDDGVTLRTAPAASPR